MEYSFHVFNKLAADGVSLSLDRLLKRDFQRKNHKRMGACTSLTEKSDFFNAPPVIVCVGSDLVIGDSLGPITGSMLRYKTQGLNVFIYGTLASPVTAKEIKYIRTLLQNSHPNSQIVTVDAAVGEEGDIGLVKLTDSPLKPGAGAQKKLGSIGDVSALGIVAEKSVANYGLLNTTRLNLVYTMSEILSDGIAALLWNRCSKSYNVQKSVDISH
jgi:putative sporulation protein YyaC